MPSASSSFLSARPRRRSAGAAALVLAMSSLTPALAADDLPVPTLSLDSPSPSTEGVAQLSWALEGEPEDVHYELQWSEGADFESVRAVYTGPATQAFESGLEDGEHHYRVRAVEPDSERTSAWSPPVQVSVSHYSLLFAGALCAIGALAFLSIVGFLAVHTRRARTQEERS